MRVKLWRLDEIGWDGWDGWDDGGVVMGECQLSN